MNKKIGVLIVGAKGAVATTLLAAQCAERHSFGISFKLPSEGDADYARLGLIPLSDMIFGGWDLARGSYSESCLLHGIVPRPIIQKITQEMDKAASFSPILVSEDEATAKLLEDPLPGESTSMVPPSGETGHQTLLEAVQKVEKEILDFKKRNEVSKVVMVNLASTARPIRFSPVHESLEAFEEALEKNNPEITSGMIYAYVGTKMGCHQINFTPSTTFDIPAIDELAHRERVALAGRDGKTGQTLYKTVIAPMLKQRGLKLTGWYSTNILGNRDGKALRDPARRASKVRSKSSALSKILGYEDFDHQVHIHYYGPRGDAKEAWDSIDFKGWFDFPMQMKINWLGDDSILAAPLVADLIRWVHFFSEQGEYGILPQLASYFKNPLGTNEHDFFKQIHMLKEHVLKTYVAPR